MIIVLSLVVIDISFNVIDVSCLDGFDGSISLVVIGGIGLFLYNWFLLGINIS